MVSRIKMPQEIKSVINNILGDLKSSKNRFLFFEHNASKKDLIIFSIIALIIIGVIIFNSSAQASFYLNFLRFLVVLIMTFFVYTQSESFWFLIIKAYVYDYNIKTRRHMKRIIELADKAEFNEPGSTEGYILLTAFGNTKDYKRHVKRYLVEICLMLFFFFYITPDFFLFNLFVFIAAALYMSLNRTEAIDYAFFDIVRITNGIKKLIKEDPKKCDKFILKNNNQETRDLKKLYRYILEENKLALGHKNANKH